MKNRNWPVGPNSYNEMKTYLSGTKWIAYFEEEDRNGTDSLRLSIGVPNESKGEQVKKLILDLRDHFRPLAIDVYGPTEEFMMLEIELFPEVQESLRAEHFELGRKFEQDIEKLCAQFSCKPGFSFHYPKRGFRPQD